MSVEEEYMRALAQFRREKDAFFREAAESPIPEAERATFKGLRYFPALFPLRVVAEVERLAQPEPFQMATSDGATRLFERFAVLRFTVGEQPAQLTAYRSADDPEAEETALFIPFRDKHSGKETYGAGRYLDVQEETGPDGKPFVVLDFNLAYNPYCAYNDNYSCPLTPKENTLPMAITAGERVFHT
jgi:uncharacterized protein (DUF1684 family)